MIEIINGTEKQNKYATDLRAKVLKSLDELEQELDNSRLMKKFKGHEESSGYLPMLNHYNVSKDAILEARKQIENYEDAKETINKFTNYPSALIYIVNNVKDITKDLDFLRVL